MTTAAMSGVTVNLQTAATTGNGTVLAIPSSFRYHDFMITGAGVVSAGAVTLETSNDPADAGTWAALASAVTVQSGVDLLTQVVGLLNFVRARVSTNITGGGNVTVTYLGAKNY